MTIILQSKWDMMKLSPFRIIKYITRGRIQDGHPAEPHEEYRTVIEPEEKYKVFILQKQRKRTKAFTL